LEIKGEMKTFEEVIDQIKADFELVVASTGALIEKAEKGGHIKRNELEKAINEATWLEINLRALKELLRLHPDQALRPQKEYS
jgi:hypothetical protein